MKRCLSIKSSFVQTILAVFAMLSFALFMSSESLGQQTPRDKTQAKKKPEKKKKKKLVPKEGLEGSIEIGARFRDITGDHPAKFQETRQVPNGFTRVTSI